MIDNFEDDLRVFDEFNSRQISYDRFIKSLEETLLKMNKDRFFHFAKFMLDDFKYQQSGYEAECIYWQIVELFEEIKWGQHFNFTPKDAEVLQEIIGKLKELKIMKWPNAESFNGYKKFVESKLKL